MHGRFVVLVVVKSIACNQDANVVVGIAAYFAIGVFPPSSRFIFQSQAMRTR